MSRKASRGRHLLGITERQIRKGRAALDAAETGRPPVAVDDDTNGED